MSRILATVGFRDVDFSKTLKILIFLGKGSTIPESATDSCEDSRGDLQIKPACAVKVDVGRLEFSKVSSENIVKHCVFKFPVSKMVLGTKKAPPRIPKRRSNVDRKRCLCLGCLGGSLGRCLGLFCEPLNRQKCWVYWHFAFGKSIKTRVSCGRGVTFCIFEVLLIFHFFVFLHESGWRNPRNLAHDFVFV